MNSTFLAEKKETYINNLYLKKYLCKNVNIQKILCVNPFSHMDRKGIKKYFRNYRTILKNCLFGQKNAILSHSAAEKEQQINTQGQQKISFLTNFRTFAHLELKIC